MRSLIALVAAATSFCGALAAEPRGTWQLESRQEIVREPPDKFKPNCKWQGESRDFGATYSMSCYSPVFKKTTVTSGHVKWAFADPIDRLTPGGLLRAGGVLENTGSPSTGANATCTLSWNTLAFTKGAPVAPGSSGRCDGQLQVPKPGYGPSGEPIRALLIQTLEFGNGVGITRRLVYRWKPDGGSPAAGETASAGQPPAAKPASGSAPDFSGRWVVGTQNPRLTEVECQITQTGNRVAVNGRYLFNGVEVLWKATGTITGRVMDTDLVYTKPYPGWGNAGDGKWVMTLSEDGQTLKGHYTNRLGQTGESHYVRAR